MGEACAEGDLALQPYVFLDAGKVWNTDSTAGEAITAASAGLGTRLWLDETFSGDFSVALPLLRERSTVMYGDESSPDG